MFINLTIRYQPLPSRLKGWWRGVDSCIKYESGRIIKHNSRSDLSYQFLILHILDLKIESGLTAIPVIALNLVGACLVVVVVYLLPNLAVPFKVLLVVDHISLSFLLMIFLDRLIHSPSVEI